MWLFPAVSRATLHDNGMPRSYTHFSAIALSKEKAAEELAWTACLPSVACAKSLMAALADADGLISVQKRQLRFAIHVMGLMTADAGGGIFVQTLPARQKDVKVIVKIAPLDDVLMAFQAISIVDGACIDRRLPGCA